MERDTRRRDEWAVAGILWLLFTLIWTLQFGLGDLFPGVEVVMYRAFIWGLAFNSYWVAAVPIIGWLGRRLPFARGRWVRAVAGHTVLAILSAAIHASVASALALLIRVFPDVVVADWFFLSRDYFSLALSNDFVIYWAILGIVMTVQSHREALWREQRSSQLESQLAKARLRALEAQLQPHFFFNALNTVSMLIRNGEGAKAVNMVSDIGDLVRRAMDVESESLSTLEAEIDFTTRYLEVERVRFAERAEFSVEVPDSLGSVQVPTMIVQPLVENAIRHGVARRGGGAVLIVRAMKTEKHLELTVTDNGPGPMDGWTEGVGISNTRKRLATLFDREAEFTLGRIEPDLTVARIVLPLLPPEPAPRVLLEDT